MRVKFRPLIVLISFVLTLANILSAQDKTNPASFDEIIKPNAEVDDGMFTIYQQDGKYYFEIPDSLLGRDIMVMGRLAKGGASNSKHFNLALPGAKSNEKVIRFVMATDNPGYKIYLQAPFFNERSEDSNANGLYRTVSAANMQANLVSFDIKARSKNNEGSLVEVTALLNGDNDILIKGPIQKDKSYIRYIHSYPGNLEIRSVVTQKTTTEIHTSLLLLSKEPMHRRYLDDRVGYDSVKVIDYDYNPQAITERQMIKRWRLEPRPGDLEKYRRGQLVQPQKPIIFYIDPATPAWMVPYFIEGVNDWQPAFEQAGFKNAIIGKKAPTKEEEPEWSLYDGRYGAVVYQPFDEPNSSFSYTIDPRSGEILQGSALIFHNGMKLYLDRYFIGAAASDPRARKLRFDQALMGELMRQLVSHEVGHALGLPHNYIASQSVPVEKLRDKKWISEHEISASIMDYSYINYVAQPEDNITDVNQLINHIGDYDKWAIEWGYRLINAPTEQAERDTLNKWIISKAGELKYRYQPFGNGDDPRSQMNDLGDDVFKASSYGIINLQFILSHLTEWTKTPGGNYDGLADMYNELISQFREYISHVSRNIGGIYMNPKSMDQQGPVFENHAADNQKKSVSFLNQQLFITPAWLLNKEILSRTGITGINVISGVQTDALKIILSFRTISRMVKVESEETNSYTVAELFSDLRKTIWSELYDHLPTGIHRRYLHLNYLVQLGILLESRKKELSPDALSLLIPELVHAELEQIQQDIQSALPLTKDKASVAHLKEMTLQIRKLLNPVEETATDAKVN